MSGSVMPAAVSAAMSCRVASRGASVSRSACLAMASCCAFFLGVYCTTLVELFPIRVRSTALAIVNNVAVLIFGGFAQFFVTWLIALTGSPLAPIFYVMIGVWLGLISVIAMREPVERGAGEQVVERTLEHAS